ncbi:MAG: hypothetical protein ACYDEX_26490 [Mobilitalea sp.]
MRVNAIKSYFKKLCIYGVLMSVLVVQLSGGSAKAGVMISYELGTGDKEYKYEDLLNNYQMYSASYNRYSITYQIEALNATIASETYSSISNQSTDYIIKLAKLRETREEWIVYRDSLSPLLTTSDAEEASKSTSAASTVQVNNAADDSALIEEINTQIATIDEQILQYGKSINSTQLSMADAKLQKDVADFYKLYQEIILREVQNKLKNEFLKKCYSLILTKEQQEYYQSYQLYLETVRDIEKIKYRRGISGFTALDIAETNLLKNDMEIEKKETTYDSIYNSVKTEANLNQKSKMVLSFSQEKKIYNSENTAAQFLYNNTNWYQLLNFIGCYKNYLSTAGSGSMTQRDQMKLKINDYELQSDELRTNIKTYVKDAILSYENAFESLNVAEKELQLKTKHLNIIIAKKEYKRATELQLRQARYEKEAAEVAYYQSGYDIVVWQNILDNSIYGVTP